MYSFPNLEPVLCFMSGSNCCFLTHIQVSQEAGRTVWYFHPFKNFLQFVMIHTVKGFCVVSKGEVHVFLEFPCLFHDSMNVGNLISGSSAFSKPRFYIWKFSIDILLKPSLKDFEHYFASVWNEHNCMIAWTFSGIAFLQNWNENWLFLVLWPLLSFQFAEFVQHFNSVIF